MNTLSLNTGKVKLAINVDGEQAHILEFNPKDVRFREEVMSLFPAMEAKTKETFAAIDEIAKLDEKRTITVGEHSLTYDTNLVKFAEIDRQVCEWAMGEIDRLFGAGTSAAVFKDAYTGEMVKSFLEGITPYIAEESEKAIERATGKKRR